MIKIAFFSNDYSDRFQLLIHSLSFFPLHHHILIARDTHQLLVSIFFQHNAFITNIGNLFNMFTQLFIQLIAFHNNLYSYLVKSNISESEFFEEYTQKALCYDITLNEIENFVITNKNKLTVASEIMKTMKKRNNLLKKGK